MEIIAELTKFIGFGSLIGVLISWFLNRKSDKDKIKHIEKKSLKNTLFILLEIRNELSKSKKINRLLQVYPNRIKERLKDNSIDELELKNQIRKIIENLNTNRIDNTLNNFNKCVIELSSINPILAYKINGKQNIHNFIKEWEIIAKESCKTEYDIEKIEREIKQYAPVFIKGIITEMDEIIKKVVKLTSEKELEAEINNILKEVSDVEYLYEIDLAIDELIKTTNIN